jgi:RNA polymerase sigma-70 factor (ECF subfamily)
MNALSLTRLAYPSKYHLSPEQVEQELQEVLAAQQDVRGFAVLYERYYEAILLFVHNRTESKASAIDITSQVFFNALDNLKKFRAEGVPFSAWLYRIAMNETNKFHRKKSAQRTVSFEADQADGVFEEMEIRAETDEKMQHLANGLQELEEEELQYIELRFFEQRAFKEIAEICGITESNAKMKVYRIIEKLKRIIKKNKQGK